MPLVLRYILCDVFAGQPLQGNPLAVFMDGESVPDPLMPQIARELNLSESVFICPPTRGGDARLRIFTPRRELPFAGHPTLGAAAVLAGTIGRSNLKLETAAGPIPVSVDLELAWMEQPLPRRSVYQRPRELLAALGLGASILPVEVYDNGIPHIYVAVESAERLAAMTPDFGRLAALSPEVGVSCFAALEDKEHWKVRMFAPGHGVDEDPATGSAAGPLAAHLIRHGHARPGMQLEIEQGGEIGRPSILLVRTKANDNTLARITVGGSVIRIGHGQLRLGLEEARP